MGILAFYLICAALLLLLNAFFVLAEFAAVKIRSSRIEELVDQGRAGAKIVKHIHSNLDEYLSVCQVGITFASIALGVVVEPVAAELIMPVLKAAGIESARISHAIVMTVGLLGVSFIHVLIGEQVPKLIAIRAPDATSILTGVPLVWFRWIFFVPLWLLNKSSMSILAVFGLSERDEHDSHSEDELRIILSRGHSEGTMSFRRLLFMENVFDFGELRARDAMRIKSNVKCLSTAASAEDNAAVIREARYSRYPLIDATGEKPLGIIHVKDLLLHDSKSPMDLTKIARPFLSTQESTPMEQLLTEMQRRRIHIAIVHNKDGRWTGFISMEDIIEEIIGTVEDEFASDPPIYLADVLTPGRVVLNVEADNIQQAIEHVLLRVPSADLPMPMEQIRTAVQEREKLVSTYLGNGIAMPHARLQRLVKPILLFARSEKGVPMDGRPERIHLMFILLTPAGLPRIHQRLQARIAGILDSDFVDARLREAETIPEILEAIKAGEQTSLD
jgi:CBS domain containing-hemolysin-like protein